MKKIFFCLSVENVGVKDFSRTDADHLWNTPKKYHKKTDLEGKNYCGLNMFWNYNKEYFNISMPT